MNENQFGSLVDGLVGFFKNTGSTAKEIYSSFHKDDKNEDNSSKGGKGKFWLLLPVTIFLGLGLILFRR